jgi:hypothetical protein
MSQNEKTIFGDYFRNFYNGVTQNYDNIRIKLKEVYNKIKNSTKKENEYKKLLNATNYNQSIILPIIQRTNIVIFSEITFKMKPIIDDKIFYNSFSEFNDIEKNDFRNFLKIFTLKLIDTIDSKENENVDKEKKEEKIRNDVDIITQTYYSLKNINDKWLTNPTNDNINGYPLSSPGKNLISQFAFVDRAMNPIGDTIINCEILVVLFNDPNVSVYTVLSQLLSLNGFEFFPLQNFMSHNDVSWNDSFKIDVSNVVTNRSAFVCMYIGGTSSYPSTGSNGFVNDGIINFDTTDVIDFNGSVNEQTNAKLDNQTNENNEWY